MPATLYALVLIVIAGVLVADDGARAATAPGERTIDARIDGQRVPVDVYEPHRTAPTTSPDGVAIVAHGFTRSRERHRDLARELAAAGVVAVVPDLPNLVDHDGNGTAIADLVDALERGAFEFAPVDRSRIVLIGTSAGGLASLLAAERRPGIAGWIGLDPVDSTGMGRAAAERLAAPAVVLLADDSTCNLFGSGRLIGRALPRLVWMRRIDGASHCDFESPTNRVCTNLCGRASPERQREARNATVGAALDLLAQARPVPAVDRSPPVPARPIRGDTGD
ncbi:MAG: alpha/beta fold hydrolase [Burkholderiales bacterium]